MSYKTKLSPDEIQALVTKAFVIEAITDKPGCTTRYIDLEDLPLTGFIHAGINSAQYFRGLNANSPVYSLLFEAVKNSNWHKSKKYNNIGLLAIMFPTVIARLRCSDPKKIVDEIINVIKSTNRQDLEDNIKAKKLAWSTSVQSKKRTLDIKDFPYCNSVWDYYLTQNEKYLNDVSVSKASIWGWSQQHLEGLPALRAFFNAYMQEAEYMDTTKRVFEEQKALYDYKMIGILSDMCAAALFLYFSFTD
jgi:hypothetical protein